MKRLTVCDQCPCLNIDYEQGGSCNLQYDVEMSWVTDKQLIYGSPNCELISIKTKQNHFVKPQTVEVFDK